MGNVHPFVQNICIFNLKFTKVIISEIIGSMVYCVFACCYGILCSNTDTSVWRRYICMCTLVCVFGDLGVCVCERVR